jgi:hypothetical protein
MRGSKLLVFAVVIGLCLLGSSCRKIADVSKPTGPLPHEPVKFTDAVPQDYGNLIAVTQNPDRTAWVTLWFQKPDGTVMAVPMNGVDGRFGEHVLRIPRK